MLKNVLENYLTSITEVQFFIPFKILLESKGFYDIHLLHSSIEGGKDFIAKRRIEKKEIQYAFQLKVGNINVKKYRLEIQPQLIDTCTNSLSHPNFNKRLKLKIVFVTTGVLNSHAALAFQEFNNNIVKKLKIDKIEVWEKDEIINDLNTLGFDKYFELQKSINILGQFFSIYSKIQNDEIISSFNVCEYTENWLTLDWKNNTNKFQVFLESFLFSKLLADKNRYVEAVFFLCALIRILIKNNAYSNFKISILEYFNEIIENFIKYVNEKQKQKSIFNLGNDLFFMPFYYSESCLKTAELLALSILTQDKTNKNNKQLFLKILTKEEGIFHPLSENYTISVVLISLCLIKLNKMAILFRFINNLTLWLCDRYENVGIAHLGSNCQQEYEHILSEYLTGLDLTQKNTSFLACALLDIAFLSNNKTLYENVANELKATEINLEFYHVCDETSILTHNSKNILTTNDHEYSLEYKHDYSKIIINERRKNKIDARDKELFFLVFLLRDRYFPTFIKELL